MTMAVRNPAAVRLLIGWVVIGILTLGGLMAIGFAPHNPGATQIFVFAVVALMFQGGAAMATVKRGHVRLAWIIMLFPQLLMLIVTVVILVLYFAGRG